MSSIRIRWSSDLDPGEGIEWRFVVETAFRLRDLLAAAGLDCWPKTCGLELDLAYADTIIRRWQALTGETAHHAESGQPFDDLAREVEAADAA